MSLKAKFAAFSLLVVLLPLILVSAISFRVLEKSLRMSAFDSARSVADQTMAMFDAQFKTIETTFQSIVNSTYLRSVVSLRDTNQPDLNQYYLALRLLNVEMSNIIGHSGDNIFLASIFWEDGGIPMLRSSGMGSSLFNLNHDYRELPLYRDTIADPYKTLWTYRRNPNSNYIALSQTLIDSRTSKVIGVLVFALYPDALSGFMRKEDEGRSLLLDTDGTVLFDTKHELIAQPCPWPEVEELRSDKQGLDVDVDGDGYLAQCAFSSVNNWRLVRLIQIRQIDLEVQKMTLIVLLVALACCLVVIPTSFLFFSTVYRPIHIMNDTMRRFGQGEGSARIKEHRRDEFGTLYLNYNDMADSIERNIEQIHRQQGQKQELEIKFLHAQIMPHFLGNTLTSIKTLARRGELDKISDMVISLISLLRMVNSPALMVSVGDELQYAEDYIGIMKVRYLLPIEVKKDIGPGVLELEMPKFLLQPLVENSVIHGFHEDDTQPKICMCARIEGNFLVISVTDNGCGMDEQTLRNLLDQNIEQDTQTQRLKFSRIGVYNVDQRLKLRYGEQCGVQIRSVLGEGTEITIRMPVMPINDK